MMGVPYFFLVLLGINCCASFFVVNAWPQFHNESAQFYSFTIPPLPPGAPPCHPSTTIYMQVSPWWWHHPIWLLHPTVPKKAEQKVKKGHPPPKLLCAANVLTAFLVAAAGTEPPDDANRSIGQTYCFGTTGNGPYVAEHIVACSHIVVALLLLTGRWYNSLITVINTFFSSLTT